MDMCNNIINPTAAGEREREHCQFFKIEPLFNQELFNHAFVTSRLAYAMLSFSATRTKHKINIS
jgi:hypothetical protein